MDVDAAAATLYVDGFDHEDWFDAKALPANTSAKVYLNIGLVRLGQGKASDYDDMARRAQYWNRLQCQIGEGESIEGYLQERSISNSKHDRLLAEADAMATQDDLLPDLFG